MSEEKSEQNNDTSVSDDPTIIGKAAQEIRENINNSLDNNSSPGNNADSNVTDTGIENDIDDFSDFSQISDDKKAVKIDDESPQIPDTNKKICKYKKKNALKEGNTHIKESISKMKKIISVIAVILFILFLIFYIICIIIRPTDKVAKNIWIGDLPVGGLSYDETLSAVEASDLMSTQEIKLKCGDKYYSLSGADIGSSANAKETARKVFDYGKSGNFLKDGLSEMRSLLGKKVMTPSAGLDRDMLSVVLNRFGTDIYGELKQHSLEFTDTSAIVTPGKTGFDMDISKALDEVEEAVARAEFNPINVTLKSAPPYDFTIETFDNICYKDPVDAYYKIEGNSVEIVPEQSGRYINKEEAAPYLPQIKEGGEQVSVPIYISYAEITEAMLREKLFANTLGSYSTNYGASTANRAANIARAASLINGTVVAPGDVFSFNNTVGPRSTANGFYTAKEYIDGRSVDGIGGGTCQVSTTLYSAVLYADMEIVSRESHMMTVGYVPLGQDATVAYGSVDFKFSNTSDAPIKIVASTNGSTITVSIVGTAWNPERTVKLSHSTSMVGENTVVNSVRYVYSNGEIISTDRLNRSVYRPHSSDN